MKKGTVLNADISAVISRLGHTDTLVVCDVNILKPSIFCLYKYISNMNYSYYIIDIIFIYRYS